MANEQYLHDAFHQTLITTESLKKYAYKLCIKSFSHVKSYKHNTDRKLWGYVWQLCTLVITVHRNALPISIADYESATRAGLRIEEEECKERYILKFFLELRSLMKCNRWNNTFGANVRQKYFQEVTAFTPRRRH